MRLLPIAAYTMLFIYQRNRMKKPSIVQVIHKAITETLSDPSVRSGLEANSQLVAKPLSLQDASKAYSEGITQFRAIAKSINLQAQ